MAKAKNKYDVYVDNKLYMHNVTIKQFCEKTGLKESNVNYTINKGWKVHKTYLFKKLESQPEKGTIEAFRQEWNYAVSLFENVDFRKKWWDPIGHERIDMRNKDEELRREGMAYAIKIAKEKGVEGLEEECRFRGASNLPLALPRNAIDECVNKIKMNTIDTVTILSAMTLRDEFDFGKKRIQKFVDRFNSKAECIMEDYTTWDEQIQILREECGLEFLIRKNDTDVKVR